MVKEVTCSAPVNIAVVKYWGKEDTTAIIPCNSSLSVTLDQNDLRSTTTVRLLDTNTQDCPDRLWLNGSEQIIEKNSRLGKCIDLLRDARYEHEHQNYKTLRNCDLPESARSLLIVSENNFPTAAGLASSASGFAALVFSIHQLYELPMSLTELSKIARQGSGSACRSIFGGFVEWQKGCSRDDSQAVQVAPKSSWPKLEALICVVSDRKKAISSTRGMQATVETSRLLSLRTKLIVPEHMRQMQTAIQKQDFDYFAEITIAESNQFHAVCLDTTPPIFYLNDVSRSIISVIEALNESTKDEGGARIAAYTFDAGPNAVIFATKENMRTIVNAILHYFPLPEGEVYGDPKKHFDLNVETPGQLELPIKFDQNASRIWPAGSISRLIHTQVGDGPQVLSSEIGGGLITLDGKVKSLETMNAQ